MKKLLALTLALLMVFSGVVGVFAEDADEEVVEEVAEVSIPEEQQNAAAYLGALGLLKGNEDGDYMLADDVQRYQAALLFARALTGDLDDAHWSTGVEAYNPFEDTKNNEYSKYAAAFNYCYQKGIINGKSATTFAPADGIILQELLAMAVRALGYTGLAYPAISNEKAVSLGLINGLTGVGFEDTLSRGEVALVLYNMIFKAIPANGTKYLAQSVFNATAATYVVTATARAIYEVKGSTVAREEYLAVKAIENGALTGDAYYLPYAPFFKAYSAMMGTEFTDADYAALSKNDREVFANELVGKSFTILSKDNLATVLKLTANEVLTLKNEGKSSSEIKFDSGKLVVGDVKYTLTDKYTALNNTQGATSGIYTAPGNYELLTLVPTTSVTAYDSSKWAFYYDAAWNIVNEKGEIQLYYNTISKTYYKWNAYKVNGEVQYTTTSTGEKIPQGYYTVATDADFAAVAKTGVTTYTNGFASKTNIKDSKNAYSVLQLIEDNRDIWASAEAATVVSKYTGYDRAEYNQYFFAKINYAKDSNDDNNEHTYLTTFGNIPSAATKTDLGRTANLVFSTRYNSELKATDVKDGDFVLVYVDQNGKQVDFLKVLTVSVGTLTNYASKTVYIDNVKYSANYSALDGACFTDFTDAGTTLAINNYFLGLFRKSVKYILLDDEVIYMVENADTTGGAMVIDSVIGFTTDGKIEVWAYGSAWTGLKRCVIATIDNFYYGQNTYYFPTISLTNALYHGKILGIVSTYTLDGNTYYNVISNPAPKFSGLNLSVNTWGYAYLSDKPTDFAQTWSTASTDYYVFVYDKTTDNGTVKEITTFYGKLPAGTTITGGKYYWSAKGEAVNRFIVEDAAGIPVTNSDVNWLYYKVGTSGYGSADTSAISYLGSQYTAYNLFNFKAAAGGYGTSINYIADYNANFYTSGWYAVNYSSEAKKLVAGPMTFAQVLGAADPTSNDTYELIDDQTLVGKATFDAAQAAAITAAQGLITGIPAINKDNVTIVDVTGAPKIVNKDNFLATTNTTLNDINKTYTVAYYYDYITTKLTVYVYDSDPIVVPPTANADVSYTLDGQNYTVNKAMEVLASADGSAITLTWTIENGQFILPIEQQVAGLTIAKKNEVTGNFENYTAAPALVVPAAITGTAAKSLTLSFVSKAANGTPVYGTYTKLPAGTYLVTGITVVDRATTQTGTTGWGWNQTPVYGLRFNISPVGGYVFTVPAK